jgi:hypothetical protein
MITSYDILPEDYSDEDYMVYFWRVKKNKNLHRLKRLLVEKNKNSIG